MSYWSISATPEGLKRVKARKKEKNLTNEDLAREAHVAIITIRRFFAFGSMSEGTIEAIAKALEMQPEEIVDPVKWRNRMVSNVTKLPLELFAEPELSPNNTFYIERPDIEAQCYRELMQPGALIRLRAPQLMGKTWLIEKVLAQICEQENYRRLDLEIDSQALTSQEDFYKWFCIAASEGLELPVQLNAFWEKEKTLNIRYCPSVSVMGELG